MSKKEKNRELQSVRRQHKLVAGAITIEQPIAKTHYGALKAPIA